MLYQHVLRADQQGDGVASAFPIERFCDLVAAVLRDAFRAAAEGCSTVGSVLENESDDFGDVALAYVATHDLSPTMLAPCGVQGARRVASERNRPFALYPRGLDMTPPPESR